MSTAHPSERKGHVCPPSDAQQPSDRWESLFVYAFICKFTNLRGKVEGLESPMDLENALLGHEPNSVLTKVLAHFILNLRPQTRNLNTDQISSTVASVMLDYFKTSERTVFWNEELKANVDPFESMEDGIFSTSWDMKLKILRVLVELQLLHAPEIKYTIDRAWGVVHNKHKKKDSVTAPPDASDPKSQESLQQLPIGQDIQRKRYWVADDSPRIYVSTNPWKVTATFQSISSTREEYLGVIEGLKSSAPTEPKGGKRKAKLEVHHQALIKALEDRLEVIDAELVRVQRVRRRIEARNTRTLLAQTEIRETRTRRRTQRPDYVYQDVDSEDDADEYIQEDDDYDDAIEEDDFLNFRADESNGSRSRRGVSNTVAPRRSARAAALNTNGKRAPPPDPWSEWRGERRSSRFGAPPEAQLDAPAAPKRARTEESSFSVESAGGPSAGTASNTHAEGSGIKIKTNGAAKVKPTETVVEQIAGKKKSKFWVYAVEPIAGEAPPTETNGSGPSGLNGFAINGTHEGRVPSAAGVENSGSMSPARSSMGS